MIGARGRFDSFTGREFPQSLDDHKRRARFDQPLPDLRGHPEAGPLRCVIENDLLRVFRGKHHGHRPQRSDPCQVVDAIRIMLQVVPRLDPPAPGNADRKPLATPLNIEPASILPRASEEILCIVHEDQSVEIQPRRRIQRIAPERHLLHVRKICACGHFAQIDANRVPS